jgi:hypothetical protein
VWPDASLKASPKTKLDPFLVKINAQLLPWTKISTIIFPTKVKKHPIGKHLPNQVLFVNVSLFNFLLTSFLESHLHDEKWLGLIGWWLTSPSDFFQTFALLLKTMQWFFTATFGVKIANIFYKNFGNKLK